MNNQIQLVLKSSTNELSLNDHELGIYLVPELDGLTGLPEIRTTSGVNSGYDGGWTSAQHYDARSITIRGVIANTDVATVERLRKQLVSLAGQGKQEELTLDLVTEAGNAYTLQVRTIALEMAMKGVLEKQEFMLQLRADDPLIYDNAESTHDAYIQVSKATGGFTIDFNLPLAITGGSEETVISNDGLEQVPTITRLYGELHNPKIINQTTNQSMQINADLGFSEGQWVDASEVVTGKTINIEDAPDNAPLASFRLDGETSQNGTPTPDAPVPVQTVTGENVVEICGKNLLKVASGSATRNQSAITISNGDINYTASASGASYAAFGIDGSSTRNTNYGDYVTWGGSKLAPGTYTLSVRYISGSTTTVVGSGGNFLDIIVYGREVGSTERVSTKIATASVNTTDQTATFTLAEEKEVNIVAYMYANSPSVNINFNIQLELGSTATTYEPYQGQSYEVNLGKNLFDKDANQYLYGYFDNSSLQIVSSSSSGRNGVVYLPCEPSTTYTINAQSLATCNIRAISTTEVLPANGVAVPREIASGFDAATFTTPSSAHYIVIRYRTISAEETIANNIQTIMASLQVEKGSQATSYAAYFTPIELCKIGDYQDYIYKDGSDWKIHKAINKAVLNGSENWAVVGSGTAGYYYKATYSGQVYNSAGKSSHYKWYSYLSTGDSADKQGFAVQNGTTSDFTIRVRYGAEESVANYATWLSTNNVSVYYIPQTATDTEITNEALIAQLETLLNTARTYAGVNNIFTVTPNEQGTLEISYYTHKTADNRDEIIIDSRLRTVTLNGLDIYHLIETGSEFLMLAPGENKLSLQSDITGDNGYAEVSYKQGYLSI